VLSGATYRLDVILLGVFVGASGVAPYSLAVGLSAPVLLPGMALATALFRRMVHEERIRSSWLVAATVPATLGILAFVLLGNWIVGLLFSGRYSAVADLLLPLSLAALLQGLSAVYNRFMSAKEQGRLLRNCALCLTVANLALNFWLIPQYGAMGAAWASALALSVNLVAHMTAYRHVLKTGAATAMDVEVVRDQQSGS
jgi:O-antigen/teichoic acid export membrane protein